jgi:hypothetical protein
MSQISDPGARAGGPIAGCRQWGQRLHVAEYGWRRSRSSATGPRPFTPSDRPGRGATQPSETK